MPPLEQFEFYRNCLVLIPGINEPEDQETVLIIPEKKKEKPRLFCACCRGSAPKCKHASLLSGLYTQYIEYTKGIRPEEHFTSHFFYKLFFPVIRQNVSSVANCLITFAPDSGGREIVFIRTGQHEPPAIQYASQGPDKKRFLSRYNHNSSRPVKRLSRHTRILQTARFVQTEIEKVTAALGSKTSRVAQEESIEESMAQIIDFKKELAAMAIDEDSPDSVKLFSRDELIAMLENTFSSKKMHLIKISGD